MSRSCCNWLPLIPNGFLSLSARPRDMPCDIGGVCGGPDERHYFVRHDGREKATSPDFLPVSSSKRRALRRRSWAVPFTVAG